jgi:hypothetical protein
MTGLSSNAGKYCEIASSRPMSPCWTSIMTATDVTGFVIEAMRKIESVAIGTPAATFCLPNAPV